MAAIQGIFPLLSFWDFILCLEAPFFLLAGLYKTKTILLKADSPEQKALSRGISCLHIPWEHGWKNTRSLSSVQNTLHVAMLQCSARLVWVDPL